MSFSQEQNSTQLGRITEFDNENIIGVIDSGNYIVEFEQISYSISENNGLDVAYHYRIRKLSQDGTDVFGLSLRNRSTDQVGDVPVDILNINVNGREAEVHYVLSPYDAPFGEDGIPMERPESDYSVNGENYLNQFITNWYRGWYYFSIDFSISDEADIQINYATKLDGFGIRYNSYPFWMPISGDAELKVTIENNDNKRFLSYITACDPTDSLTTEEWQLTKSAQNIITITYTPGWFSKAKKIDIGFSSLNPPWVATHRSYFRIVWGGPDYPDVPTGVFLINNGLNNNSRYNNISRRLLSRYELIFLNNWQLRIMRNSFYALRKYRFADDELNKIFYSFEFRSEGHISHSVYDSITEDWFNASFTAEDITPIERENIGIIQILENFTN